MSIVVKYIQAEFLLLFLPSLIILNQNLHFWFYFTYHTYISCYLQAVKTCEDPSLVNRFSVRFDDLNSKAEFLDTDLVGPGFKPVTSIKLEAGQLVYVTHMQREMAGRVVRHDFDSQDVIITLNDVSTYRVGQTNTSYYIDVNYF